MLTSPVFTERTLAWEDKRQYMHALTSITIISNNSHYIDTISMVIDFSIGKMWLLLIFASSIMYVTSTETKQPSIVYVTSTETQQPIIVSRFSTLCFLKVSAGTSVSYSLIFINSFLSAST